MGTILIELYNAFELIAHLNLVLPSPSFYVGQEAFKGSFGSIPQIAIANPKSNHISTFIDAEILALIPRSR